MRPLTLRLNGLRSYLTEQEIDFTDVDLMAIIGDTGAGKSSLLEALCVALYGCCTWDARGAKPLIADGATTLRVELTFRVGERTWKVTRAISRGAYPPAIHLLECLDDGTRVDNGDPVNAAIRKLIGLDFSTFLKAVVLPQGRFQILLQMSNTDRTPILRSILGLDQLTAVREAALELAGRLRPQLAALGLRRAALLADPDEARGDARRRLEEAEAAIGRLGVVKKKISEARETQSHANARAGSAESAAEELEAATVADAVEAYERLIAIEAHLSNEAARAQEELSTLEGRERELDRVLERANRSGVGVAQLATAHATLTRLIGELPDLETESERCGAEAEAMKSDRHDLTSRIVDVDALEEQARQAEVAVRSAEAAAQQAEDDLDAARTALEDARLATHIAADAARKAQTAAALRERLETEAAEARRLAQEAQGAHATAAAHLEVVRRSAAAAHAASASHAGDPCPICKRALPDGFVAPEPPGEKEALSACSAAEDEAKSVANLAAAAAANAENAHAALDTALTDSKEGETRRVKTAERATQLLRATDLLGSDDELLAATQALVDATATALTDARGQAQSRRDEVTGAKAELRSAEEGLAAREKALTVALTTLERRQGGIRESAAGLPPDHRVAEPFTVDALSQVLTRVERRQNELADTAEQLTATRRRIAEARAQLKDIETRRDREIDVPVDRLRRGTERLADRTAQAAGLLGEPGPVERGEGPLTVEAGWTQAIVATATSLVDRLRVQAQIESATAAAADGEIDLNLFRRRGRAGRR